MEHEQRLGIGLLAPVVCLAGLIASRGNTWVQLTVLTSATLLACAGFVPATTITAWRIVYAIVPGAMAVRGVARIGMLLLVPASIGLALALDQLQQLRRTWIAISLGLASLMEQGQTTPSFEKNQNRADVSSVARNIASQCKMFFYSPVQGQMLPYKYQLDAMWAQMETGVPTINGYSGNGPPGWQLQDANIRGDSNARMLEDGLTRWSSQNQIDRGKVCWVKPVVLDGPNASTFLSQSVPRLMQPGQSYNVALTFRNTGSKAWTTRRHHLGFDAPQGYATWGMKAVDLPSEVKPGAEITIQFQVTAPMARGQYFFRWQMFEDGLLWFGSPSDTIPVTVAPDSLE
jgi:hypothetical protein